MNQSKLILFLIILLSQNAIAQIGESKIGMQQIGGDSLMNFAIGKSATPKCALPGSCNGNCATYIFKGSGNWNIEGNWEADVIPPTVLSGCAQIVITPAGSTECLLNIPVQVIPAGTSITIMPGKKFRIPGKLLRQ